MVFLFFFFLVFLVNFSNIRELFDENSRMSQTLKFETIVGCKLWQTEKKCLCIKCDRHSIEQSSVEPRRLSYKLMRNRDCIVSTEKSTDQPINYSASRPFDIVLANHIHGNNTVSHTPNTDVSQC